MHIFYYKNNVNYYILTSVDACMLHDRLHQISRLLLLLASSLQKSWNSPFQKSISATAEPANDAVVMTEPANDAVVITEPANDTVVMTEPVNDTVVMTEQVNVTTVNETCKLELYRYFIDFFVNIRSSDSTYACCNTTL